MKKFFEEPAIECIRLVSESVAASSDLNDGSMGTAYDPSPDVPQG